MMFININITIIIIITYTDQPLLGYRHSQIFPYKLFHIWRIFALDRSRQITRIMVV